MLSIVALVLQLAAARVEVAPSDPNLLYTGRVGRPTAEGVRLSWSGTSVRVRFEGASCSVRLKGSGNVYTAFLDGKVARVLDLGKGADSVFEVAAGLQGVHEVSIEKRTEPLVGVDRFGGFSIDGRILTPAARPSRRIEFIGNSITCGYGILDSVKEHGFSPATEDHGSTYAALAAKALQAEEHAIAWSGKGVWRNYEKDTLPTMPVLWERTDPTDPSPWSFGWTPDVVVVDLGTNDFNNIPVPDSVVFHTVFSSFLRKVHARYPKASIVLLDGPMLSDYWPVLPSGKPSPSLTLVKAHLAGLARELGREGIRVGTLSLTPNSPQRGYGADWHPNRAQSVLNADELVAYLRQFQGWK